MARKIVLFEAAVAIVLVLAVVGGVMAVRSSYDDPVPALQQGRLAPCPATPNCVNSEYPADDSHYIAPFELAGDHAVSHAGDVLARMVRLLQQQGAQIVQQQDGWLAATVTTRWVGYMDDVQFRLDDEAGVLHVRSSSRLGRSDFGVNRERVEALRARWLDAR